jgi:hypothetical protein
LIRSVLACLQIALAFVVTAAFGILA